MRQLRLADGDDQRLRIDRIEDHLKFSRANDCARFFGIAKPRRDTPGESAFVGTVKTE
jgi:hypothetical protein